MTESLNSEEIYHVVEIFLPSTLTPGEPLQVGLRMAGKPPLKLSLSGEVAVKLRHFLLTQPIS